MTASDICRIIKSCGTSGVKHFAFGELEFLLGDEQVELTNNSMLTRRSIEKGLDTDGDLYDTDTKYDDGQQDMFEADLDDLALSDPEAFEELTMNGGRSE